VTAPRASGRGCGFAAATMADAGDLCTGSGSKQRSDVVL
jgi:hypothetical protein